MQLLTRFLVLATVATSIPLGAASAAPPPRVEGYHCSYLTAQYDPNTIWQTWFRGTRKDLFDRVHTLTAAPCFQTEANCKAWLYWAQSDWRDWNTFQACRTDVPY